MPFVGVVVMARNGTIDTAEKIRLLRALAFQIHRKQPAGEALNEYLDDQFALGRRREYRPAADALNSDGFVAALRALEMVGEEAALLLSTIVEGKDHRLLSAALNNLADYHEAKS